MPSTATFIAYVAFASASFTAAASSNASRSAFILATSACGSGLAGGAGGALNGLFAFWSVRFLAFCARFASSFFLRSGFSTASSIPREAAVLSASLISSVATATSSGLMSTFIHSSTSSLWSLLYAPPGALVAASAPSSLGTLMSQASPSDRLRSDSMPSVSSSWNEMIALSFSRASASSCSSRPASTPASSVACITARSPVNFDAVAVATIAVSVFRDFSATNFTAPFIFSSSAVACSSVLASFSSTLSAFLTFSSLRTSTRASRAFLASSVACSSAFISRPGYSCLFRSASLFSMSASAALTAAYWGDAPTFPDMMRRPPAGAGGGYPGGSSGAAGSARDEGGAGAAKKSFQRTFQESAVKSVKSSQVKSSQVKGKRPSSVQFSSVISRTFPALPKQASNQLSYFAVPPRAVTPPLTIVVRGCDGCYGKSVVLVTAPLCL